MSWSLVLPPKCKAAKCRYPRSHNTEGHVCGNCKQRGHGRIECTRPQSMNWLRNQTVEYFSEQTQCRVQGCKMKPTHTTEGHIDCTNDNPNKLYIKCPTCNGFTPAILNETLITGEPCIVCFDNTNLVPFERCRHCNVCPDCVNQIHETYERTH